MLRIDWLVKHLFKFGDEINYFNLVLNKALNSDYSPNGIDVLELKVFEETPVPHISNIHIVERVLILLLCPYPFFKFLLFFYFRLTTRQVLNETIISIKIVFLLFILHVKHFLHVFLAHLLLSPPEHVPFLSWVSISKNGSIFAQILLAVRQISVVTEVKILLLDELEDAFEVRVLFGI